MSLQKSNYKKQHVGFIYALLFFFAHLFKGGNNNGKQKTAYYG